MNGRTFTASDLAAACKLDLAAAQHFLTGPEGFIERGLVVSVGDGYRVTQRGWELSGLLALAARESLEQVAA
jgi:hypothetical protein